MTDGRVVGHGTSGDAARSQRSGAVSFRIVGFGLAALAVTAVLVGVAAYVELLRYRRVAAHHLPPDTVAAFRIDVEQVVLYEPTRKHLFPLINAIGGDRAASRVARLREKGGINLGLQLREIVLAFGPSPGDWTVVVGGLFDAGVLDALEVVLRAEGTPVVRSNGTLAIGTRLFAARASDGAVVFGPSIPRLELAMREQSTYRRLGLDDSGPGSFTVSRAALRDATELGPSGLSGVTRAERALGKMQLRPDPRVFVHIDFSGPEGQRQATQLQRELTTLRPKLLAFAASSGAALPVEIQGSGSSVTVEIGCDEASLDRAGAELGSVALRWIQAR
jgi:hypothetical protein